MDTDAYERGYRARVETTMPTPGETDDWYHGFNDAHDDIQWFHQGVDQMQFGLTPARVDHFV